MTLPSPPSPTDQPAPKITPASSPPKRPRGFAKMVAENPDRQRAIASAGGRAAHEQGVAHKFDTEEARAAGRKSHQTPR